MRGRRAWILVVLLAVAFAAWLGYELLTRERAPDEPQVEAPPPARRAGSTLAKVPEDPPAPTSEAPASPPPRRPQPSEPQPIEPPARPAEFARRLFEDSVRWIANGGPSLGRLRDLHVSMEARLDLDGTRHEGPMEIWLQAPDRYRQESSMGASTSTRVLAGGNVWIRDREDVFTHLDRTADGASRIQQVQDDVERIQDLDTFLTLAPLDGPGVTFEWAGEKRPSGSFARQAGGTWAKIVRKAPGRPDISLWLAHERDAEGQVRATYPGVVRVEGEPLQGVPTEDFILQQWDDAPPERPRAYRFPRMIRAYQIRPDQPALNFLTARVTAWDRNAGIDRSRFEPR